MSNRVLLIEDNDQNSYLLTFLLERHGYVVVRTADGVHGIEVAKEMVPALILLDIQLPRMDGYEVARELRRHEALRQTPIVAITSYAMAGDREKALSAGCSHYIEKPINPDTFIAEVEVALRGPEATS
jgi:two-component system, cell cycle response regulator DivK